MIKNKKLLGILLAASMMSGLTACQSSDAKKPEDTGNVRQSGCLSELSGGCGMEVEKGR